MIVTEGVFYTLCFLHYKLFVFLLNKSYFFKCMKFNYLLVFFTILSIFMFSFHSSDEGKVTQVSDNKYTQLYDSSLSNFFICVEKLEKLDLENKDEVKKQLFMTRVELKKNDFWLRYLDPNAYRNLNAPLPVEYETEVFEKFEKPYRREGGGVTLIEAALDEDDADLEKYINLMSKAKQAYFSDSIHQVIENPAHFYFANRLFLLNIASIYTTGFECPDTNRIVPELKIMVESVKNIYQAYNASHLSNFHLPASYLALYESMHSFILKSSNELYAFDHFSLIKKFVNPLYKINQESILALNLNSKSVVDYSLNRNALSIFDKDLYNAQNEKGIYRKIKDEKILNEIKELGRLLFYDPILSGNNQRSCASCHNPNTGFAQSSQKPLDYDKVSFLKRNTPSLLNVKDQHLIMYDGNHISLQGQAEGVIKNKNEMNGSVHEIISKIKSCKVYKKGFKKIVQLTPSYPVLSLEHIQSALVLYYSSFSNYKSPFDDMMEAKLQEDLAVKYGFNVFMGKAKCATCHFVPTFTGVKPPYNSSEFEVLGIPDKINSLLIDQDKGRAEVFDVPEMRNAFRTSTLRNLSLTTPYMHNGIFTDLQQVIDFYDQGGGVGSGIPVENQTLPPDKLNLSVKEKEYLELFLLSLNERIPIIRIPESIPNSSNKKLNNRKINGEY
jgi:cytochrome c peroxidase